MPKLTTIARVALVFVAASVGGALLDQLHVQSQTLSYAHPHAASTIASQPWWVGPQFGVAITAQLIGATFVVAAARTPRLARTLAFDAALFVGAYAVSALGHQHEAAVTLGLAIIIVARMAVRQRSNTALRLHLRSIVFITLFALGGTAYESVLTRARVFTYHIASLGTVPTWLPLLYFVGALPAVDMAPILRRWLSASTAR